MSKLISFFVLTITLATILFVFISCGSDDDEEKHATQAKHLQVLDSTPVANKTSNKTSANSDFSYKKDLVDNKCEEKCFAECKTMQNNRSAFYKKKRNKIKNSPFKVKIDRVYLTGSCARGDIPEKRRNARGIKAIVEGKLTYTADDVVFDSEMNGTMYLKFGKETYHEVPSNLNINQSKSITRITRDVRGSDPWIKDETRPFHFESEAISEAFCGASPDEAAVYMEIKTNSIKNGLKIYPLAFVDLTWDEILGIALKQQIMAQKSNKNKTEFEPADAHYSKLDRILITRLTGKTEWVKRNSIVQSGYLEKGPSTSFPTEGFSKKWNIKVTNVSSVKEFGGYAHKGDDQYLIILDIEVTYKGEEEGLPSRISTRLETTPNKWQKPAKKSLDQIDLTEPMSPGSTVSGKIVFPRQRFERPFRLKVETPDAATIYIDIMAYDVISNTN